MTATTINNDSFTHFAESFGGRLIHPDATDYDAARTVWNGLIDRRPALIARCASADDVVRSVRFARENNLLVSIRGGGHHVAGYAVCDDGLMIDMSAMRRVDIDPQARTARVQAGALWADVDGAAQPHGLTTPGGEVSLTGVAGLTLGGGVGYVRRKFGLSCDNLLAVEIVTADGRKRRASERENSDLFWALRGGGGNFGVVVAFEFRLHPVGPEVVTLNPIYPFGQARSLLEAWRRFTDSAPDEASTAFAIWGIPEHPDIPVELHGTPVCLLDGMYCGPRPQGEALFQPLREVAEPIIDLGGPTTYLEAQKSFDEFMRDGDLYYWKSLYLNEMSDDAVDTMMSWVRRRPNPRLLVIIRHLGGAISRVAEDATAYQNRAAQFMFSIDGAWTDPAESERNIAWIRGFWEAMSRYSNGGVYVNFPGFGENPQHLWRSSYGNNYRKLVAVKTKYDPANFFRMNQNIKPVADKAH
ncbi:MAG: FAD-binding oxidoreductase [Desulfofustis sp.]|jgi:FAD/FMN-containing dehydrogenase|nr:FAD-binding oxidoreductase [Desulfofustis sp.]